MTETDTAPATCRWVASDRRRAVTGRHLDDCATEECPGCQPCAEDHCPLCRRVHATTACPECTATTRDDLRTIATLCGALPTETVHRGIESEAAMLWGPTADPEAWRNRAMSAMQGRLCRHPRNQPCPDTLPAPHGPACEKCDHHTCRVVRADTYRCDQRRAYLEDCRDEKHPLWILGTWEQAWRDRRDQPTDLVATLPRIVDYLDRHLHEMAGDQELPFDDFARDLRACRGHLEDVLHEGDQVETGAPCPGCDRALVKVYGRTEAFDSWQCPSRTCGQWFLEHEYRRWVSDDYRANADALTAPDLEAQYDVAAGSVRGWASKGEVRRRGKDSSGRQLYDVDDVLRRSQRHADAASA